MTAAKAVKLRSNCIFFLFIIGLVEILSKSLAIIKCDLNPEDFLVWRYPDSSPALGSQIIVSQSQQAIVLASGELVDILEAGSHTLLTANIPIFKDYLQDGSESFPFDIWFVNKISITSYKWGTKSPIQFREKQFGVMLPIGSYGSYECEIKDFQAFLLRVVGTRYKFSSDDLKEFLAPLVERELLESRFIISYKLIYVIFFFATNFDACINLGVEVEEGCLRILIETSNTQLNGLHLITKNGKRFHDVIQTAS